MHFGLTWYELYCKRKIIISQISELQHLPLSNPLLHNLKAPPVLISTT